MDDIIVIILTLVLTIVAAINQSKKKKQQETQNTSPVPDFWETILHGEEGTPVPVNTPRKPQPSEPVLQQTVERKAKARTLQNKSGHTVRHHPEFISDEGGRNQDILMAGNKLVNETGKLDNHDDNLTILEDFSLRKAIIYSEIIQPKYF